MQSRRSRLPTIEPLRSFAEVVGACRRRARRRGRLAAFADLADLVVGPEGGWSEAERGTDVPRVRLGRTVLRAETAAVAAGALLVALREGLVTPSDRHAPR